MMFVCVLDFYEMVGVCDDDVYVDLSCVVFCVFEVE